MKKGNKEGRKKQSKHDHICSTKSKWAKAPLVMICCFPFAQALSLPKCQLFKGWINQNTLQWLSPFVNELLVISLFVNGNIALQTPEWICKLTLEKKDPKMLTIPLLVLVGFFISSMCNDFASSMALETCLNKDD